MLAVPLTALDGEGLVSDGLGSVAMARTTAFRLRILGNDRRLLAAFKKGTETVRDGSEVQRIGSIPQKTSCVAASIVAESTVQRLRYRKSKN